MHIITKHIAIKNGHAGPIFARSTELYLKLFDVQDHETDRYWKWV